MSLCLKRVEISSVKLPDASEESIKNNYLYNHKKLFDDGGLNWYNDFRNYDPQIMRFIQFDNQRILIQRKIKRAYGEEIKDLN